MKRASPSVKRTASILRFMASHPEQAFSLTELARALKLSPATCHSLLSGLIEVGFLFRTSNKGYVLGPELAIIGQAAAEHVSPLQIAQPEMRALADEFDVVCSASFLTGYVIEIRERAESFSFVGSSTQVGAKFNVNIPLAAPYIAWWSNAKISAWLDRHPSPPPVELRDLQQGGIEFARRFGFVVFAANRQRHANVTQLLPPGTLGIPVLPLADFDESENSLVVSLTAPVFASRQDVAFALTLTGFNRVMPQSEIFAIADRLKATCARIGEFVSSRRLAGEGPTALAASA